MFHSRCLLACLLILLAIAPSAMAEPPVGSSEVPESSGDPASTDKEVDGTATQPASQSENDRSPLVWHDDYGQAYAKAKAQQRMLLINFTPLGPSGDQRQLEQSMAANPRWREKLHQVVLVRLPQNAQIVSGGNPVRLLSHAAFAEMHGRPGIAVLDLVHPEAEFYGRVVSAFPFMSSKYYRWRADYLPTILDLPPGTITQRTMVWAVRVHPERPASTSGMMDNRLGTEARQHCEHQARIGVQGHHRWGTRFRRIRALLGAGSAVEVVAESWPAQNMIDSCIDCVDSWRHSPGHWNAVRTSHTIYAYDIRQGNNGIWYGTGIFAGL